MAWSRITTPYPHACDRAPDATTTGGDRLFFCLVTADAIELAIGVVVDNDVDGSTGVDTVDARAAAAAGRDDADDMCGKR